MQIPAKFKELSEVPKVTLQMYSAAVRAENLSLFKEDSAHLFSLLIAVGV